MRWWADDDSEDEAPMVSKAKTPAQMQEKQPEAESESDNDKLVSTVSDKLSHGGKSLCASSRSTFTKKIIDLTIDSDEDLSIHQWMTHTREASPLQRDVMKAQKYTNRFQIRGERS